MQFYGEECPLQRCLEEQHIGSNLKYSVQTLQNVHVHYLHKDQHKYRKGYFATIKGYKESLYLRGLEHSLWTSNCSVQILPTISCVALDKLIPFLVSQFLQT